ncbi:MAG: hypothetical protein WCK49_09200 [Myxococcaceae bacterium]
MKSFLFVFAFSAGVSAGPFKEGSYTAIALQAVLNAIPDSLLKDSVPPGADGYFNAKDFISDEYKKSHALIWSLIQTSYYALHDSNGSNANISHWKFDMTSMANVPGRGAYYAFVNFIEGWSRDNKNSLGDEYAKYVFLLGFLRNTGSMLSYNSRYEDTIIGKYQIKKETIGNFSEEIPEAATSFLAGLAIAWDNLGWFYLVAMQTGFINEYYYSILPRPAKLASTLTQYAPLAAVIYSVADISFTYGLMCIKNTFFQLISPTPKDCSICYFGTNAMGPHGAIGEYVFAAREGALGWAYSGAKALWEFWKEPIAAMEEEEL